MPHCDEVRKREERKNGGLSHRQYLGGEEQAPALPPVDEDAREGCEEKHGDHSRETDETEEEWGIGEPITSQLMAIPCIHVPIREVPWPTKKSR